MEWNKVIAALLVAAIVAKGGDLLARNIISPAELDQPAYVIDTSNIASTVVEQEEEIILPPVANLLQDADPEAGSQLFRACQACHSVEEGGPNKQGPNLWGIIGAPFAHLEDFRYSDTLASAAQEGRVWSYEELNHFLYDPREYLPGTVMGYAGMRSHEDRANLIAWLRTMSSDPPPLPEVEDEAEGEENAADQENTTEPVEGGADQEGPATDTTLESDPAGDEDQQENQADTQNNGA